MVVVLWMAAIKDTPIIICIIFILKNVGSVKQQMSVLTRGVDEFIIRDRPQRDEIPLYF